MSVTLEWVCRVFGGKVVSFLGGSVRASKVRDKDNAQTGPQPARVSFLCMTTTCSDLGIACHTFGAFSLGMEIYPRLFLLWQLESSTWKKLYWQFSSAYPSMRGIEAASLCYKVFAALTVRRDCWHVGGNPILCLFGCKTMGGTVDSHLVL